MNSQLAYIIMRGMSQGATPAAIAQRIETAYLKGELHMTEQYLCKDCQQPMETIQQGQHTVVTCKHKDCPLYGVTLSTDQYAALTPIQLDGYRKAVISFKERHHA